MTSAENRASGSRVWPCRARAVYPGWKVTMAGWSASACSPPAAVTVGGSTSSVRGRSVRFWVWDWVVKRTRYVKTPVSGS